MADRADLIACSPLAGRGGCVEQKTSEVRAIDVELRPWGRFETLWRGWDYQLKRIVVLPGKRLSLQYHRCRSEHWTVLEGTAEVTVGDDVWRLYPQQGVHIPTGTVHRLANCGSGDLVLVEVQRGSYLGEDDIVRLADDFGRSGQAADFD